MYFSFAIIFLDIDTIRRQEAAGRATTRQTGGAMVKTVSTRIVEAASAPATGDSTTTKSPAKEKRLEMQT